MKMIEFIAGAAIGAGAIVAKDVIAGDKEKNSSNQQQLNNLYAENEKLRNRNREAERKIEDLMAENQRLKKRFKEKDETSDDLEDDLADARRKIKKLLEQNDELTRKVQQYKAACDSYEAEINKLKA